MDESSLVDDIALRFPLPDNHLTQRFDTQSQPCAGVIHCEATYLMLSNCKGLNLFQLLSHEFPNAEFAVAVGTCKETCFRFIDSSPE
jgi:hypothetical protein